MLIEDEWRKHFVAYEDALASFYSLHDATQETLEDSRSLVEHLARLASLRKPILEARRQLRAAANGGKVTDIDRERTAIDVDGVTFAVMDLVANRAPPDDTVLELSFRVAPKSISKFVKLTEPVRIRFPFGDSTFVALCRLVRFRMVRDEFAFRFATVDPD
jgi:hypothetical protein